MKPAFTTILMATDFGPEAGVALRSCASLARQLNASVHLMHIVNDPVVAVTTPELYGIDWDRLRSDLVEQARQRLASLSAAFPEVIMTIEVAVGSAAETIAQRAADLSADLVVVGTHGRGGFGHLFIGSVAERVIRLAPCPVMTVRASGATHMKKGEGAVAAHAGVS